MYKKYFLSSSQIKTDLYMSIRFRLILVRLYLQTFYDFNLLVEHRLYSFEYYMYLDYKFNVQKYR